MCRKILTMLLIVCMSVTLFGCGTNNADSSKGDQGDKPAMETGSVSSEEKPEAGEQKVSYYSWAGDQEQVFEKALVDEYMKSHPEVEVEANFIPYAEYLSKINTMKAAGSMPDIFKLPEGNVYEWGEKGAVLDLKPLYDKAGINPSDESLDQAIFQTDDNIWSVGMNVATLCLYYNKDILTQYGIEFPSENVTKPWSWTEFVENAKKLTRDTNGKTPNDPGFNSDNVVTYGTMMPTGWSAYIALLHTNDSGIADADGKTLEISKERGIETIQAIADLSLKDKCAPGIAMAKGAFSDSSAMLINGQLATIIDGSWALANYTNEGFDVGVAPIPVFLHPADISWTGGVCMSPDSEKNGAAFDFYRYLTDFNNSIDSALSHDVSLGGLPHTLSVFDGGENEKKWASAFAKVDTTKACATFKEILQDPNTIVGDNVTLKNFPEIVDNTIVPMLDNVWLGEMTAREALESIDVSQVLDGYWK